MFLYYNESCQIAILKSTWKCRVADELRAYPPYKHFMPNNVAQSSSKIYLIIFSNKLLNPNPRLFDRIMLKNRRGLKGIFRISYLDSSWQSLSTTCASIWDYNIYIFCYIPWKFLSYAGNLFKITVKSMHDTLNYLFRRLWYNSLEFPSMSPQVTFSHKKNIYKEFLAEHWNVILEKAMLWLLKIC